MPKNIKQLPVKIIIATFGMALLAVTAWAATPSFMNYHSRLRDASGFPISASTSIRFTIYNDATNGNGNTQATSSGGPVLWSELYDQGLGNCAKSNLMTAVILRLSSALAYLFLQIWILQPARFIWA